MEHTTRVTTTTINGRVFKEIEVSYGGSLPIRTYFIDGELLSAPDGDHGYLFNLRKQQERDRA